MCAGYQRSSDGRLVGEGGVSGRRSQPGRRRYQERDAAEPEGGRITLQQNPSL